jgi:hypothetical protein
MRGEADMSNAKQAKRSKAPIPAAAPLAPKINKARHMTLVVHGDQTEDRAIAEAALSPEMANASTTADYTTAIFPDICLQDCIEVMQADVKAVNGGNLDKLEGMLTAQAEALNAIFNNFAKRAIHSTHMPQLDIYTRLAMKAQAQCRTTVEAIAEIKYPKSATFIKEANIAQQQQVNNGKAPAHAREKDITPTNELLTESAHAALDTGRTGAAISLDPQLEAMGKSKRAAH